MNTEPDKMSYKGIAPILCEGGEPYPNPNLKAITFVLQLLRVNFCTEIFVKLLYVHVVLCCV